MSAKTTFLLIRHASTDWLGNALAGWKPAVHLNAAGRRQAEQLAARLGNVPLRAVYTSPLERAVETADPLARALGGPIVVETLGEIRFGEWTGCTLAELAGSPGWERFNRLRSCTRIPGGEWMLGVQLRMVAELERLRGVHPGETVALVSHADVIRGIIAHYAGIPLDLLDRLEIGPASVSIVELDEFGPRLLRLNDTGDLLF